MGAGASSGEQKSSIVHAIKESTTEQKKEGLADFSPGDIAHLKKVLDGAAGDNAIQYTLYVQEKGIYSMKVMIFLAEANLMKHVNVVSELKMPEEDRTIIKEQFKEQIEALDREGETYVPCLKGPDGFCIDDNKIIDFLAQKHEIVMDKLQAYPMFNHGVYKDYELMMNESSRLAGGNSMGEGLAWFNSMDRDGSGDVSLEEMIQGLDLTRIMAQARRGVEVSTKFDRWQVANEMVDVLVVDKPDFVDGWRLRMVLGTISDDYDKIIDSANKIIGLKEGDAQALTLKALYTKALGLDGYESAMKSLRASNPAIADRAQKTITTVGKYWDVQLTETVPKGITDKMSIIALGSPADDDGTPRPRLLGTLKKTLEAAQAYPDADIFVTGAAVSSNMPEAIAMTRWLKDQGINEKRITKEMKAMDTVGNYVYIAPMLRSRGVAKVMLITAYYHLNRSSCLADAVFEQQGLTVDVVGVAGESDLKGEKLEKRMAVEKPASYRDLARAANLYEFCDFE